MENKKAQKEKTKGPTPKEKEGWLQGFLERDFFKSGLFYLLVFLFVFGLSLFLRLLYLSSDPPIVSWSEDLTTDAPAYTSFARSKILSGDWNPFGQYRFILWLNSAYTLVSFLFFKLSGVGRFQANLISVFFNFFTLLFIYLAVKKALSKNIALLSSLFLGINYILLIYSRSTFSEISTLFFIALGLYFFVLGSEKKHFFIFSGAAHASAILFGKILAGFILPVCLGVLILLAIENFSKKRKKIKLFPAIFFLIGFLGVSLPWYLMIYYPVPGDVKFYLKEMSVGLYGAPIALQSIKDFIQSIYSFGYTFGVFMEEPYRPGTDLFYRMPFMFLFSCLFLIFYFLNIFKGKFLEKVKSTSRLEFYLVFWAIIGFLALMLWNYRPLRYQLLVIPPFCVLAGIALNRFLNPIASEEKEKLSWVYWIFFLPICSIMLFHLFTFFLRFLGKTGSFNFLVLLSILLAILPIILWYLLFKHKPVPRIVTPGFKLIGIFIMVLLIFFININQYANWAKNPQYSLIRSSQDLGKILNQDAVVSGPYAPPLTLDNNLSLILHMFGVAQVDPLLFKRYPITHLALEDRGGNKEMAFRDYPEVMLNAQLVTTYILRKQLVEIYRIKEHTGNPEAERYELSDFEKGLILIQEEKFDSATAILEQFNQENPENLSAHLILSDLFVQRGDYHGTILEVEKAIKFDQRNALLYYYLGYLYFQLSDLQKSLVYWNKGIEAWEKSLELSPGNTRLTQELQEIRGY